MTIHFHIPGQPVGKGRPRIGKVGAHARMFTPAKTVNYESTVALFAASMIERDEALMRQALESLQWSNEYLDGIGKKLFPTSKKAKPGSTSWNVQQAIKALKARLEESK